MLPLNCNPLFIRINFIVFQPVQNHLFITVLKKCTQTLAHAKTGYLLQKIAEKHPKNLTLPTFHRSIPSQLRVSCTVLRRRARSLPVSARISRVSVVLALKGRPGFDARCRARGVQSSGGAFPENLEVIKLDYDQKTTYKLQKTNLYLLLASVHNRLHDFLHHLVGLFFNLIDVYLDFLFNL
jgi:hypothetical protein